MARSARRPSRRKPALIEGKLQNGASAVGAFVSQNPAFVGGTTSFLIALAFVSANAIWYQPHAHTSPFFATRSFDSFAGGRDTPPAGGTTFILQRPTTPLPTARPASPVSVGRDPAVQRVQSILKDLGYYDGTVDGIPGPATFSAISAYQRKMGLGVSGRIDKKLLSELGAGDITGSIPADATSQPGPSLSQMVSIEMIQAGLKAFGNHDIGVDGVLGERTRDGIREFQALFGMPQTGEPEIAVLQKMQTEGLVD